MALLYHDYGPQNKDGQPLPWQNVTADPTKRPVQGFAPDRTALKPREASIAQPIPQPMQGSQPVVREGMFGPNGQSLHRPLSDKIARAPVTVQMLPSNMNYGDPAPFPNVMDSPAAGVLSHELDKQAYRNITAAYGIQELSQQDQRVPPISPRTVAQQQQAASPYVQAQANAANVRFQIGETQRDYLLRQEKNAFSSDQHGKTFSPLQRDEALLMKQERAMTGVNNYKYLPNCYKVEEEIAMSPEKEIVGNFSPDRSLLKYNHCDSGDPFLVRYVPHGARVAGKPNETEVTILGGAPGTGNEQHQQRPSQQSFSPDRTGVMLDYRGKLAHEEEQLHRDSSPQRANGVFPGFGPAAHSPVLHARLDRKRAHPALMPGNPTRALVPRAKYGDQYSMKYDEEQESRYYGGSGNPEFSKALPSAGGDFPLGRGKRVGINPMEKESNLVKDLISPTSSPYGRRAVVPQAPTLLKDVDVLPPKEFDVYTRSAEVTSPSGVLRDYKNHVEKRGQERNFDEANFGADQRENLFEARKRHYNGIQSPRSAVRHSPGVEQRSPRTAQEVQQSAALAAAAAGQANNYQAGGQQPDGNTARNVFLDNRDMSLQQLIEQSSDHPLKQKQLHNAKIAQQQFAEELQRQDASRRVNSPHAVDRSPTATKDAISVTNMLVAAGGDSEYRAYLETDRRGRAMKNSKPEPVDYDGFFGPARSRMVRLPTGSDPSGIDMFPSDPQRCNRGEFAADKKSFVERRSLNHGYYESVPAKINHTVVLPNDPCLVKRSPCKPREAGFFGGRFVG
ncbi:unnamed protein product [Amoebophrya sp. A120]|nr:unnamed protein product [Amoebophrya sp. A120]|eukprot:GSA120T00018291001.1